MKKLQISLNYLFLIIIESSLILFLANEAFPLKDSTILTSNTIAGMIFDNNKNPLPEVPVELMNDLSQVISRSRTDSVGRYSFVGMPTGRYQIRVIPARYDFEEQTIEVELLSLSFKGNNSADSGNDSVMQDFYLQPRRGAVGVRLTSNVVFVQEVPKSAENLYERAVKELGNNRKSEGVADLEESIKIFPDYFLALNRLGFEKFVQEDYVVASEFLARASDVNPQNINTLYLLAQSLHMLKRNQATIKVLKYILLIDTAIPRVSLLMGTVLRIDGQYQEAEKYLLQAKKLSKKSLPDVHWQLALLYGNNLKQFSFAADELEIFLKTQPKSRDFDNIKKLILKFREKAIKS